MDELFFSLKFWNLIEFIFDSLFWSVTLEYWIYLSINSFFYTYDFFEYDLWLPLSSMTSDFLLFLSYSSTLELSFFMLLTLDDFLSFSWGLETLELCLLFRSSSSGGIISDDFLLITSSTANLLEVVSIFSSVFRFLHSISWFRPLFLLLVSYTFKTLLCLLFVSSGTKYYFLLFI